MKIKNKKKLLNIIIISASIVLSILTMMSIMLFNVAKKNINLNIKSLNGNNYISNIKIGETTYYVKDFSEAYDLELLDKDKNSIDDDRLLLKQGESLNFDINAIHNVNIHFDKKNSNGKIEINYDGVKKVINTNNKKAESSFSVFNTLSSLLLNEIKSLNRLNYLIIALLILLFCFIYKILINKILDIINKIKNSGTMTISQIVFCFITYFLVNLLCMLPVIEVLNKWYSLIIVIQMVTIIYYLKDLLKNKLHCIFAFLAIILCVNMSILMPPFHVPDEFAHYLKSYSIFNRDDVGIKDGKHYIKMYGSTYNTIQKYVYDLHGSGYRITIKEYFADSSIYEKGTKATKIGFENTATLNPFAYIPSAIIIKISQVCNFPFMFSALLGRIINALIFIILGFLAIKIIPFFKKIFFVVMLFPITIQQVTAINQDSVTLSILFFLLAVILKAILDKEKKISTKNIWLIIILSIFLGMCKPVYFLIILLIILIPNKKFKSKKQAILFKALPISLCFMLSLFKFFQAGSSAIEKTHGNFITVSYVIQHPLNIIKMYLTTFYRRGALDLLTGQLNLFGWSTVYYDYLLSFIIPNVYLFILLFDNENIKQINWKKKIFIFLIAFVTMAFIYTSAMLGFSTTTVDSEIVADLQSRYFIPVTLLFLISISSDFIKSGFKNKNIPAIIVIIFTYMISFYTIIKGFYI